MLLGPGLVEMFNAYPQQRVRPCLRWKVLLPLLVTGLTFSLFWSSTVELSSTGATSRPVSAEALRPQELRGLRFLQPFLASPGFEVGIWTRQRGVGGVAATGAAPGTRPEHNASAVTEMTLTSIPAAGDGGTAVPIATEAPAVAQLREQLEAERARAAEQQAELDRLRRAIASASAAGSSSTPAASTLPASAAPIPESLWRQPPGSNSAAAKEPSAATGETTGAAATTTTLQVESLAHSPRISVKAAGGKQIIVQISRADEPLPASTKTTTEAPPVATTTTSLPPAPTPAPPEPSQGKITVKAGGSEIIVQFGDHHERDSSASHASSSPKTQQKAEVQPPAATLAAATPAPGPSASTTPSASLLDSKVAPQQQQQPVAQQDAPALAAIAVAPPVSALPPVAVIAKNATAVAGVGAVKVPAEALSEAPEKRIMGTRESPTKITVKSQGHSITIELSSKSEEASAATSITATSTTTPASTTAAATEALPAAAAAAAATVVVPAAASAVTDAPTQRGTQPETASSKIKQVGSGSAHDYANLALAR